MTFRLPVQNLTTSGFVLQADTSGWKSRQADVIDHLSRGSHAGIFKENFERTINAKDTIVRFETDASPFVPKPDPLVVPKPNPFGSVPMSL